jgi:hemin uptake protein HemP
LGSSAQHCAALKPHQTTKDQKVYLTSYLALANKNSSHYHSMNSECSGISAVKKQHFHQAVQPQLSDVVSPVNVAATPVPAIAGHSAVPVRCVESANLLGGAREVMIAHNGRQYRLRVTAQQKLILTA